MTFGFAWALLGLLAIPLLVWLERRRRRPRPLVWPSLLLWEGMPEDASARRRRVEPLLLLECLGAGLLALAAAEPALSDGGRGRHVAVLLDTAPMMRATRADGRTALEATREEVERIRAALGPDDAMTVVETAGDLRAVAAGLDPDGLRVVASARPGVDGPGWLCVGRAPQGDNVGIDAVEVEADRLGFALACDGEPRTVRVRVGDDVRAVETGTWIEAGRVDRIELVEPDNYAADDRVALRPLELTARDETGSPRVRAALFRAGLPAREAVDAALTVRTASGAPLPGPVHGADCIAEAGPFEGLVLDGCVWERATAIDGPVMPLLRRGEAVLAGWAEGEQGVLLLGLPVDREWDENGTLAVLVERAKRARADALLRPGEIRRLDLVASREPGFVATRGVDRPWDGVLPDASVVAAVRRRGLTRPLAGAAVLVLVFYLVLRIRAGSLGESRSRGIVARP